MAMGLRIGIVERLAADRAEAGAIRAAERLLGQSEHDGVVCPAAEVQLAVNDVGAAQLLVTARGLVDLASIDPDLGVPRLQAANARAGQLGRKTKAKRIAAAGTRHVEVGFAAASGRLVVLATQLYRVERDLDIDRAGLPRGQRQALQIDDSAFRIHSLRG